MQREEYLIRAVELAPRGNDLPQSKLNPDKVRAIRENRYGKTAQALADEHGVHIRTIDKVRDYRSWVHVR